MKRPSLLEASKVKSCETNALALAAMLTSKCKTFSALRTEKSFPGIQRYDNACLQQTFFGAVNSKLSLESRPSTACMLFLKILSFLFRSRLEVSYLRDHKTCILIKLRYHDGSFWISWNFRRYKVALSSRGELEKTNFLSVDRCLLINWIAQKQKFGRMSLPRHPIISRCSCFK